METKKDMGNKLAQIVYEGKWFTPLREAIQAFVESTQESLQVKLNSNFTKETSSKPELLLHIHYTVKALHHLQQVIYMTTMMLKDSSHYLAYH